MEMLHDRQFFYAKQNKYSMKSAFLHNVLHWCVDGNYMFFSDPSHQHANDDII